MMDKEITKLIDMLHLEEKEILERFRFTLEGKRLTKVEATRFIHFLREELGKKAPLKH
ncbi:hypothetical protein ACFQI7_20170 [Paenibacillus allorhizosphaerae]|uniref:Uncharacterized protein n=1 Tax=Paenibacillus allorhizosphaerae TaxID=2849866 RepID=A0ABM8VKU2_9BACL|nr:hypothetical protein [Paenibacillus allorhizosphaerae]CAG7647423.1 hypothetical protein PAECIP111802_03971 [Paenibacillus allorhizosphaerae]